jgi:AcrR family transcriptional regulator
VHMVSRGPYAKGVAKRDEILRTALEVFAKNGYLKTSIRDLAEAANLSQAGLLHYFGSKEELLVAIVERREEENRIARGDADVITHLLGLLESNTTQPGLARLFATMSTAATDADHPAHEFFVARNARVRATLADAVRERQRTGELDASLDPTTVATLLTAAADGLQEHWLIDGSVDMPRAMTVLWQLVGAHRPRD